MNRYVVINLIIYGLITGLIFGIFSVIPYLGLIMLFIVLFLTAPVVMLYLIMAGKYDISDEKNAVISGAISGFSSNITYAGAFSIISILLYFIFKYNPNFFLTAMIIHSPIWLLVLCILFVGVVTATTNAFSGFITYYIINMIRDIYAKKHNDYIN